VADLLLTGSKGYLGSAVAARLEALSLPWQPLPARLEDIEPQSLDCSVVIHCAGVLRHLPQDWQRSNVEGMARLLAGLQNPARIVFASSRSVYALSPTQTAASMAACLSESSPLSPRDGYGASKLAAETLLRESRHSGVSCRLTTLFGDAPRGDCPSLPSRAMQSFRRGELVRLVKRDIDIDYLAVADAARLLVEIAMRDDIREPVINLAGPQRSLHALVATLAEACAASSPSPARIAYDFPPAPPLPCLDTTLLRQLLADFTHADDHHVFMEKQ